MVAKLCHSLGASVSVGLCLARAGSGAAVKLHSHKVELMCYSAENPHELG